MTCKYSNHLKRELKLFRSDLTAVSYSTDDGGKLQCASIVSSAYYAVTGDVTFTEQQTDGKIYRYAQTVRLNCENTFMFGFLRELAEHDWYAVFTDTEGDMYVASVDFPMCPTYTLTLTTDSPQSFTLNLSSQTNVPSMKCLSVSGQRTEIKPVCGYANGLLHDILYGRKDDVRAVLSDGKVSELWTRGSGLTEVDYLSETPEYTFSYDGSKYTTSVRYSVRNIDDAKKEAYNITEYQNNRYVFVLQTSDNYTVVSGGNTGLTATVNADMKSDDGSEDTLEITFTENSDECIWYAERLLSPRADSGYFYVPVPYGKFHDADGYAIEDSICLNASTAIYTIAEVRKQLNTPSNDYVCYSGFQNEIKDIATGGTLGQPHSVPTLCGTYTSSDAVGNLMKFPSPCADYGCYYEIAPKDYFEFSGTGTQTTRIQATCAWSISNVPSWLNISPTSGSPDTVSTLTVRCTRSASATPYEANIPISMGGITSYITVRLLESKSWINQSISINGKSQTCSFLYNTPPTRDVISVTSQTPDILTVYVKAGQVDVTVPRNISGSTKGYSVVLHRSDNNTNTTITVTQSSGTSQWITDGTICDSGNLYNRQKRIWVYSADEYDDTYDVRLGTLIEAHSAQCRVTTNMWIPNEDTTKGTVLDITDDMFYKVAADKSCGCLNTPELLTKYRFLRNVLSNDGGYTWQNNTDAVDIEEEYRGYPLRDVIDEYESSYCLGRLRTLVWDKDTGSEQNLMTNPNVSISSESETHYVTLTFDVGFPALLINGATIEDIGGIIVYDSDSVTVSTTESGGYENGSITLKVRTKNNQTTRTKTIDMKLEDLMGAVSQTFYINQSGTETVRGLRFTADGTQTVSFDGSLSDVPSFQYSVNDGFTWTDWTDPSVPVSFGNGTVLWLRGENYTLNTFSQHSSFIFGNDSVPTYVEGNILYLLSYTATPEYLPAAYCYSYLFQDCKALAKAPELPMTNIAEYCYFHMFDGCTSLRSAPVLPATSMRESCYAYMFYGCSSLTDAPALPATDLAQRCYQSMFQYCTSLSNAPELPATTLAMQCYIGMFSGCRSLMSAPELNASMLVSGCYSGMFYNCTNLRYIKCLARNPYMADTLTDWTYGVSPTGTFSKYQCVNWNNGTSGIPTGWDVIQNECPTVLNALRFSCNMPTSLRIVKNSGSFTASFQYSTDEGTTWSTLGSSTTVNFGNGTEVLVRGNNPSSLSTSASAYYHFVFGSTSGDIYCSGNIMSLVNYTNPPTTIPSNYFFTKLFQNCSRLAAAPELPATTLKEYCYYEMFSGCSGLRYAPTVLPSTTVPSHAYYGMFRDCTTYLQSTPKMDAVTVATYGCYQMYQNCYALSNVDMTAVTSLDTYSMQEMFNVCTSLQNISDILSIASAPSYSCKSMFDGCTSLRNGPALPATTLSSNCYENMFSGCSSLTDAPELPATDLAANCYSSMFRNCTKLSRTADMLATSIGNYSCYYMYSGCKRLTQATAIAATTVGTHGCDSMFRGCTNLSIAPVIYASSVGDQAYAYMFANSGLTMAPALPATTLGERCYYYMFSDCYYLSDPSDLPAMTLSFGCYQYMYNNCTSLRYAPELPATTLSNSCYYAMFKGCTNLTGVSSLPATTLAQACYYQMFYGCTSLMFGPDLDAANIGITSYYQMFYGCTALRSLRCMAETGNTTDNCYQWLSGVSSSGLFTKWSCVDWGTGVSQIPSNWEVENIPCGGDVEPLTFTADGSQTISITDMDSQVLYYSVNGGRSWTAWNGNAVSFGNGTTFMVRGINTDGFNSFGIQTHFTFGNDNVNTYCTGDIMSLIDYGQYTDMIPNAYCFAFLFYNCKALVTAPTLSATTIAEYCYYSMYQGCNNLRNVPDLPATSMREGCYERMFADCRSLVTAPRISANSTSDYCFQTMFVGCTSLQDAPLLLPTVLSQYCYDHMFYGCMSLVNAPELNAPKLAQYCYSSMFEGCSALRYIRCIAYTHYVSHATDNWTLGVPSTGTFVKPACTTWERGNSGIPEGWTVTEESCDTRTNGLRFSAVGSQSIAFHKYTSTVNMEYSLNEGVNWYSMTSDTYYTFGNGTDIIIRGSNSGGINTAASKSGCSYFMFGNSEKVYLDGNIMTLLNYTNPPTVIPNKYCFAHLFNGCNQIVTPPELTATTLSEYCYYSMFRDCTNLRSMPELPSVTAQNRCYALMFYGCYMLKDVTATLPLTTLAEYCCYRMFMDSAIETAPELPVTTLTSHCYYEMFRGCNQLVQAPSVLPATETADYCYSNMFQDCLTLERSPLIKATPTSSAAFAYMFYGCTALKEIRTEATAWNTTYTVDFTTGVGTNGTFYKRSDVTVPTGTNGIPSGWDVRSV